MRSIPTDAPASDALRWRRLLVELVRIPSAFGEEHAIVARVADEIRALGCAPELVMHDGLGRASIAARLRGSGNGRSIVLSAHLDTVPPGAASAWTHPPFGGFIDEANGVLYGRGSMDDKAGVAIALGVLQRLTQAAEPLAGDVVFHFVIEDETTGEGSRRCLDAGFEADAAFIIDGTRLDRAIDQHAGQLQFDAHVAGTSVSVSVAHLGCNALELLAELVIDLKGAVGALNADVRPPWDRFPSPFALVTQRLAGEGVALTVPERAESTFWMTFPPPFTLARARGCVEETARRCAARFAGGGGAIALTWNGFAAEPVAADAGELSDLLNDTARRLALPPIAIGPSTGTSDMRHFVARGIPCVLYGPGAGHNPHRADEHYYLADLQRMIAFYATLIPRWCNAPPCR